METLKKIFQYRDLLYIVVALILSLILFNKCADFRNAQEEISRQHNNIEAMRDTLTTYVDELGRMNGEIHAYQLTQEEMTDSLGKIEKKNREYVSYLKSTLGTHDTVYAETVIERNSEISDGLLDEGVINVDSTDVFTNNSSRTVKVRIPYRVDSLLRTGRADIEISQDIHVEGWMERDTKTGETFLRLRSDYPNITFNSGMGIVASNSKEYDIKMRKSNGIGLFIGPSLNIGADPINPTKGMCATVGISVGIGYTFTPKRLQWGK